MYPIHKGRDFTIPNIPIFNSLVGYSVNNQGTFINVPKLNISFNFGIPINPEKELKTVEIICFTDLSFENIQGLFSLLQPKRKLKIIILKSLQNRLIEICKSYNEKFNEFIEIIGIEPNIDIIPIQNYFLNSFFTKDNENNSIGYFLFEKKRVLKPEFQEQLKLIENKEKKNFLKDDKKYNFIEETIFTFVKDIDINSNAFQNCKNYLLKSEILCIGCNDFQNELEFEQQNEITDTLENTMNLKVLNNYILNHYEGKKIIITYLPYSLTQDGNCNIYCFLIPRILQDQRSKLTITPHRYNSENSFATVELKKEEEMKYSLEKVKSIQNEREWKEYKIEYLDLEKEGMTVHERVGYFGGGEQKRKKIEKLMQKYPNGYEIIYEFKGKYMTRKSALLLYEDAYVEFLKNNVEIANYVSENCCDVFDTEIENIESGFDYEFQIKSKATHLQDVAIRRAMKRLGLEFKGKKIMQVRGYQSPLFCLNPAYVPFHVKDAIQKPEIIEAFMLKGSVESFWQSNKTLATRKLTVDQK
ncbi:hypothetical protein ABK040_002650 [Willaertia magna]